MVRELNQMGFEIELVLADSLYGESESKFLRCLEDLKLNFAVAIRRNHGVWLPKGQTVRCNRWRKFERIFSDKTTEVRYVREIIFGKKRSRRFWTSVAGGSFHRHSLGNYDRPGNNARKLNLVCNDRDSWVELQRCWQSIWL